VKYGGVQFRGRGYLLYQLADMYRGGPNPLADMDRGPYPRGVKIRCDTGLNQIEALKSGGFSWSEIARTLGISDKTLRRRRHKLGMRVEGREYSNLSDHDLDNSICNIVATTPGAGFRLVQGGLRECRITVQRHRVLHSMHRIDPVSSTLRNARRIVRRTYNVPCPNALW
jgi:hypothetical protein